MSLTPDPLLSILRFPTHLNQKYTEYQNNKVKLFPHLQYYEVLIFCSSDCSHGTQNISVLNCWPRALAPKSPDFWWILLSVYLL